MFAFVRRCHRTIYWHGVQDKRCFKGILCCLWQMHWFYSANRINNMVIAQDFVCSKEGFREKNYMYRKDRILPPSLITREGCPATLRLALRDGVKWVVTKFVKLHNHSLMSPGKVPWPGSNKSLISEDEKDWKIRELTQELNNEKQKCKRLCAAYQEQLHMILKSIKEHTGQLSTRVEDAVKNKLNKSSGKIQVADIGLGFLEFLNLKF